MCTQWNNEIIWWPYKKGLLINEPVVFDIGEKKRIVAGSVVRIQITKRKKYSPKMECVTPAERVHRIHAVHEKYYHSNILESI